MLGFGFQEHGSAEGLGYVDIAEPVAGPGLVRIRIHAAGFNRLDRFTLAGIPGVPVDRPHVLGSDGAGEVDSFGDDVTDLTVGTQVLVNPGLSDGTCDACLAGEESFCRNFRILGEHTQGSATRFIVVPRRNVYPLPRSLNYAEGAAVPLVFQTAWRALKTVAQLRPGERVAIIGAGGGVTTAAVQIAKRLGGNVAVASRTEAKAERTRSLGADDILVFGEDRPLDKVLWDWSGKRGVDVIFDSVGAPTVPRSLRALARGGRVVVIGATAGPLAEIDLRTLFWRQSSLRGSTMANRSDFDEVLALLARGDLKPVLDSIFPFEQGAGAFSRLDAPDLFGKVILRGPTP
ncbi:MAG: zinc-binding dehydrogenase [Thermoplasmata archaeon]